MASDADDANVVYHRCLLREGYGHALYKETPHSDLKPGTIGYFDADKDWQPILQLTDQESLLKHPKLTAIKNLHELSAKEGPWAAIVSEGVDGMSVAATVDATAPDGSGGGFNFEYTTSKEESAILATDGTIMHRQLRFKESGLAEPDKLRAWMFRNLETILGISGAREKITEKGLWLVTKTYTVKRAAIALLRSKNMKTSFGITARVLGVVEASPSAAWWNKRKGGNWKQLNGHDGNEVVLFVSGIWWIPSRNFLAKQWKAVDDEKKHRFLGGESKPLPIGVEFPIDSQAEKAPERIIFEAYAMGDKENLGALPQSKRSPFADPNSEEEKHRDQKDDDSDNEVQEDSEDNEFED
ncbi:hypothetical protein ACMFMG_010130 [Clarireedia jacksonii]